MNGMEETLQSAYVLGIERVKAWSDLLDDINVFPIADGDTGRNLISSLAPLLQMEGDREETIRRLLMAARGNSGNIANRFFTGLLTADSLERLPQAARIGRDNAWEAVHDPVPGTMLTVFDALVEFLEERDIENREESVQEIIKLLEKAVRSTQELLPTLKQAGVVDSGALGMYVFLEGFFKSLINQTDDFLPITTRFQGVLTVSPQFQEETAGGYCVDTVVQLKQGSTAATEFGEKMGESTVVIPHQDYLKVHLHTSNREELKEQLSAMGDIVEWSDDDIGAQIADFKKSSPKQMVHIMTDAAGSVTLQDAQDHGITLLDSYINAGDKLLPETLFSHQEFYQLMLKGVKVSTSQASVFERHQYYQRVLEQNDKVLYICVGSAFTGNYMVAMDWKEKNDPDNRFTVLDSQAASGRLGMIVLATVRFAAQMKDHDEVVAFARKCIDTCEEYVFLDKLQYLAAGGRLAKTSAFFGDTFRIKPIVSPLAEGAVKVGTARNPSGQLKFALERLHQSVTSNSVPFIMLEFSNNRDWVNKVVKREIEEQFPFAKIILQPLSLTSSVHMGPGTWALAFLPGEP
jgi:uncharacterized protein